MTILLKIQISPQRIPFFFSAPKEIPVLSSNLLLIMNWAEGGEKEIMLLSVVYLLKGIEMILLKPQNIILQSYFTSWGNFCLIMYKKIIGFRFINSRFT